MREKPRVYQTETLGSVLIGSRFRHGRQQAGMSQRRVAELSGVSQSLISRFERGRCPGLAAWRIMAIAVAIGPRFPFGFCPHDHKCKWPYNPSGERTWYRILND
jgi:transcriptional regulator with XRE-family HTH domain